MTEIILRIELPPALEHLLKAPDGPAQNGSAQDERVLDDVVALEHALTTMRAKLTEIREQARTLERERDAAWK